jgi:hypothetical protein
VRRKARRQGTDGVNKHCIDPFVFQITKEPFALEEWEVAAQMGEE